MKLKVGDTVDIKKDLNDTNNRFDSGEWYADLWNMYRDPTFLVTRAQDNILKLNSKTKGKSMFDKLSILAKKLLDTDTKVLVEAGYLDSELELTDKGEQLVLAHYVEANKADLAKIAQEELDENKKG